jgi:chitinase
MSSPNLPRALRLGKGLQASQGSLWISTVWTESTVKSPACSRRKTFTTFTNSHGRDEVDWEHPTTPEDGAYYLALLHDVRLALPSPSYLLTTALPVGEYCLKHIDLRAAAHVLDYINLMCYDFTGPWTPLSGHHAQLHPPPSVDPSDLPPELRKSSKDSIAYLAGNHFPLQKIVLGIPVYARFFSGAGGPGRPFTTAGEIDYVDLPREWIANADVDQECVAASWKDGEGGKGFVSFDVTETVRAKARFAMQVGLAGLFFWTGVGDVKGPDSLVVAGFREMNGR